MHPCKDLERTENTDSEGTGCLSGCGLSGRLIYTVKKEIMFSGDSDILHGKARDTTRKSEKHKLIGICITNYFVLYLGIPATLNILCNSV